ncbi:MAG: hypothetical protein IT378_02795 [Sandaracinaceae bacterium]|nr:hypothetical protein [Sandaracinaceae bacterium]
MSADITTRIEELQGLCRELTTLASEGRWRQAAEIAGALELDLDELRQGLRARHREEVKAARARGEVAMRLRAGAGKRLKTWREQRKLRSERPPANA